MNARELIEAQHGEGPDPGPNPRPDRPDRPLRRIGGPMGMGPLGAQRGDFNPREVSQLKDYMLLELVRGQGAFTEGIVQKLVTGGELEPGELQHFIDEADNIPIPENLRPLVQKVKQVLAAKQGGPRGEPGEEGIV